jgi:chemotaxis regulatin CheY-phosphate phosphatase CheZ
MEILMAQDFQDLTGQVIKKMMEVVNDDGDAAAAGADRQLPAEKSHRLRHEPAERSAGQVPATPMR